MKDYVKLFISYCYKNSTNSLHFTSNGYIPQQLQDCQTNNVLPH